MSAPDRRAMLDRADTALSIRRQCALLGVARSGVYRPPRPANDNDLALMRRIDEERSVSNYKPVQAVPLPGSISLYRFRLLAILRDAAA